MSAHTIGTCYELASSSFEGQKIVTGEFTGSASYDSGGSVLDLSSQFSDEVRGGYITDRTGEFQGYIVPTAITNLAATTKVLVRGISWDDVVLAHDNAVFNAAATSDNADVWAQPALTHFCGVRTTLTAKFAGTGPLTAGAIILGDTGGTDDNGFYEDSVDLVGDAVGSTTTGAGDRLGLNDGTVNSFAKGATNRKLTATATGGDWNATTAGSVTLRCYFIPADSLTGSINTGAAAEVHSGQVLSGTTFTFLAWGTDA